MHATDKMRETRVLCTNLNNAEFNKKRCRVAQRNPRAQTRPGACAFAADAACFRTRAFVCRWRIGDVRCAERDVAHNLQQNLQQSVDYRPRNGTRHNRHLQCLWLNPNPNPNPVGPAKPTAGNFSNKGNCKCRLRHEPLRSP